MRERLILLAAALIAFGASLGSGFHFDDYAIFSDPALQSARGWLDVWAPLQTRPLTYLTFWLNRQLGAGDPLGYHLFNLLFHLAAVLVAWECLRRLLPERAALVAGVLFALHPIQSEAVDYVWARGIVLAALFCFAALWQWLEGRAWIAVACFAGALLAKEECAAFPLLVIWLEWRGKLAGAPRRDRRRARRHLPVPVFAGAGRGGLPLSATGRGAVRLYGGSGYPRQPLGGHRGVGAARGRDTLAAAAGERLRHMVDRRADPADPEFFHLPCRRRLRRPPHVSSDVRLRGGRRPVTGARKSAGGARRDRPPAGGTERATDHGLDDRGIALARGGGTRPPETAPQTATGARLTRREGPGATRYCAIGCSLRAGRCYRNRQDPAQRRAGRGRARRVRTRPGAGSHGRAQHEQSRRRPAGARANRSRPRRFRTRATHSSVARRGQGEPRQAAPQAAMSAAPTAP